MSQEIPKLHGWITPDYAKQMIKDLLDYLNDNRIYAKITYELYTPKLVGWRNDTL